MEQFTESKNRDRRKITKRLEAKVFALHGERCFYCHQTPKQAYSPLCCDHQTPRCRGGLTVIENLIPICWPCNGKKSWRTHEEFLEYATAKGYLILNDDGTWFGYGDEEYEWRKREIEMRKYLEQVPRTGGSR